MSTSDQPEMELTEASTWKKADAMERGENFAPAEASRANDDAHQDQPHSSLEPPPDELRGWLEEMQNIIAEVGGEEQFNALAAEDAAPPLPPPPPEVDGWARRISDNIIRNPLGSILGGLGLAGLTSIPIWLNGLALNPSTPDGTVNKDDPKREIAALVGFSAVALTGLAVSVYSLCNFHRRQEAQQRHLARRAARVPVAVAGAPRHDVAPGVVTLARELKIPNDILPPVGHRFTHENGKINTAIRGASSIDKAISTFFSKKTKAISDGMRDQIIERYRGIEADCQLLNECLHDNDFKKAVSKKRAEPLSLLDKNDIENINRLEKLASEDVDWKDIGEILTVPEMLTCLKKTPELTQLNPKSASLAELEQIAWPKYKALLSNAALRKHQNTIRQIITTKLEDVKIFSYMLTWPSGGGIGSRDRKRLEGLLTQAEGLKKREKINGFNRTLISHSREGVAGCGSNVGYGVSTLERGAKEHLEQLIQQDSFTANLPLPQLFKTHAATLGESIGDLTSTIVSNPLWQQRVIQDYPHIEKQKMQDAKKRYALAEQAAPTNPIIPLSKEDHELIEARDHAFEEARPENVRSTTILSVKKKLEAAMHLGLLTNDHQVLLHPTEANCDGTLEVIGDQHGICVLQVGSFPNTCLVLEKEEMNAYLSKGSKKSLENIGEFNKGQKLDAKTIKGKLSLTLGHLQRGKGTAPSIHSHSSRVG